jgi:uncharacterized protein YceK
MLSVRRFLVLFLLAAVLMSGCQSLHHPLWPDASDSTPGAGRIAWVQYDRWQEHPVVATAVIAATVTGVVALLVLASGAG